MSYANPQGRWQSPETIKLYTPALARDKKILLPVGAVPISGFPGQGIVSATLVNVDETTGVVTRTTLAVKTFATKDSPGPAAEIYYVDYQTIALNQAIAAAEFIEMTYRAAVFNDKSQDAAAVAGTP